MKKYLILFLAVLIPFWACEEFGIQNPLDPGTEQIDTPADSTGTNVPVDTTGTNVPVDTTGTVTPPGPDTPPEPEPESVVIFAEDFDGNTSYTGYMTNSDWYHFSGEDVEHVTYDTWNSSIRNDNYGSAGKYTGASGQCYGRLTQANSGNMGYWTVNGIGTCGYKDFKFSFGAEQNTDVMTFEWSVDGTAWHAIAYEFSQSYDKWALVSGTFSIPEGSTTLSLKFTLVGAKDTYKYGANLDDILIESAGEATTPVVGPETPSGQINKYIECPAKVENSDYYYNTLYTHTVKTNKAVRNFSFCYDTRRHNPIWVAFPMHAIYAEGSGRSKDEAGNDPWMMYPDLPLDKQSIIWEVDPDNYPGYQYWTYSSLDAGTWTKGHLCMSSSRSGAGLEINLQTFYPVNIAPQSNATAGIFSEIWGDTEEFHWQRGDQICADTLYVVAGCHYANDNNVEYDAAYRYNRSSYSKPCIAPTHQYKLFLRTRNGNTGKAVQNCSASELKCIGFWMDAVIPTGSSTDLKDYAMSVADIEKITGLTFFPGAPAEVKQQCNPSDWGL